jgi:O-antigen ligase
MQVKTIKSYFVPTKVQNTFLVTLFPILVTLLINPNSADTYTHVKFLIIALSIPLVLLPPLFAKNFSFRQSMDLNVAISIFGLSLILTFLTSKLDRTFLLFGNLGRNTGLITYIGFSLIILVYSRSYEYSDMTSIFRTFTYIGYFEVFLGYLQWLKLDPTTPFRFTGSRIVGTLGNQDFYSAFLGMFIVFLIYDFLQMEFEILLFLIRFVLLSYTIVLLIKSDSQQGIYLVLIGVTLFGLLFLQKSGVSKIIKIGAWIFSSIIFLLGVFGAINRGIFAKLIYENSITDRGHMWRTAWHAFLAKPLTGWGFDSYKFYESKFRNTSAIAFQGKGPHADSAHNLFLDLAANGGVLLISSYVIILLLIFSRFIKAFRVTEKFDSKLVILFTLFFIFNIQNFISVGFLAVSIWGFIFTGLSYGYSTQFLKKQLHSTTI